MIVVAVVVGLFSRNVVLKVGGKGATFTRGLSNAVHFVQGLLVLALFNQLFCRGDLVGRRDRLFELVEELSFVELLDEELAPLLPQAARLNTVAKAAVPTIAFLKKASVHLISSFVLSHYTIPHPI